MSAAADTGRLLDGLSRLSGQQWAFRLTVPVATVAMLMLERLAGASYPADFTVVAVVLSLLAAVIPDSSAPLFLVLALALHWAFRVPEQLSVWVLLAAVVLLVIHVACILASYGPPSLVLEAVMLARWLRRCLLVVAVTVVIWLLTRVFSGLDLPDGGWVLGLALLAVIGWTGFLARRLVVPR